MQPVATNPLLTRDSWLAEKLRHEEIVQPWISPRLARRAIQKKHPVDDFLFEYYPISANKLRTWHPGFGFELDAYEEDYEYFNNAHYCFNERVISLSKNWLESKNEEITKTLTFLQATKQRPARTGCFGLHEWAMVLGQDEVRHETWQLRITQNEIRETIEKVGLRCTHFDAFRFFTDQARPMNPLQLTRADQSAIEQPGCLHANMDLYKYAQKFAPIFGSEIIRIAFSLARDIRTVDMQVAPYELSALGVLPIRVETAHGRLEFAAKQQQFSDRAQELRESLIEKLTNALNWHAQSSSASLTTYKSEQVNR